MTSFDLDRVPPEARTYCHSLWFDNDFDFKVKGSRQTKLGDYRRAQRGRRAQVTVNENLPPESFLITYIHEVAHHVAYEKYGKRIQPHGSEWKNTFKELMSPILVPNIFSESVLTALKKHMSNPKASSASDPKLWQALNPSTIASFTLNDVENGASFEFKSRTFRKITKRRTRVLCEDVRNGKKYLIPAIAEVEPIA